MKNAAKDNEQLQTLIGAGDEAEQIDAMKCEENVKKM